MATNHATNHPAQQELTFAGDTVCLAGQIDYPDTQPPTNGFPLVFMLHHAGANTRHDYAHFAEIGLQSGCAVFRWDKRGTGRSGASGRGSTTKDAIQAYKTALGQRAIDPDNVIIFAQCAGTLLLGEAFRSFADLQLPRGVLLASNMLDEEAIQAIHTRIFVVMGEEDWNDWQIYARQACERHNALYNYGAEFHLVPEANRMLLVEQNGTEIFHADAHRAILAWLQNL